MPGKIRGLLHWSRKVTEGYEGIEIKDMTSSWRNGLVFCAIINRFRPDLIDFYSLSADNVYHNNNLAFTIAEKEFGIAKLLDPNDMVEMEAPDRYSIATYVSSFYETFNNQPMYDPPEPPVKEMIKDNSVDIVKNTTDINNGANARTQEQPIKCIDTESPFVNKTKSEYKSEYKTVDNEISESSVMSTDTMPTNDNSSEINDSEQKRKDFKKKNSSDSSKSHSSKSSGSCDSSESSDDDISDLYDRNKEILNKSCENHEQLDENNAASTLKRSFSEICKSEIEELQKTKPNAVLEAALSAGMAVVAVSAVSEDKQKMASKLDQNPVCQTICQEMLQNEKKKEIEVSNKAVKDFDRSHVQNVNNNGIDSDNQKTIKDLTHTSLDSSSSESEFSSSLDKETSPEETVKALNIELNKGNLEIVNVDLEEESDQNDCKLKSKTMSLESEDHVNEENAAEKIASEIVENVFKEVSKNPELFQEIPSIVKEVESGFTLENEESDTSSQSSEADDITISKSNDKANEGSILSNGQENNITKIHNDNLATSSAESFYSFEDQLNTDNANIVESQVLEQTEPITAETLEEIGCAVDIKSNLDLENIEKDNSHQENLSREDVQIILQPSKSRDEMFRSSNGSNSENEVDNENSVFDDKQNLVYNKENQIECTQKPKLASSSDENEMSILQSGTSDSGLGTLIVDESRNRSSSSSSSSSSDSEKENKKQVDENVYIDKKEYSCNDSVLPEPNDAGIIRQNQIPVLLGTLIVRNDSTSSSDSDKICDSIEENNDAPELEMDSANNSEPNDWSTNNQVSSASDSHIMETVQASTETFSKDDVIDDDDDDDNEKQKIYTENTEFSSSQFKPDIPVSVKHEKWSSSFDSSESEKDNHSQIENTKVCNKEICDSKKESEGSSKGKTESSESDNERSSSSSSIAESDSEANVANQKELPIKFENQELEKNIGNLDMNKLDQACKQTLTSSSSESESDHNQEVSLELTDIANNVPVIRADSLYLENPQDKQTTEMIGNIGSVKKISSSGSCSSDSESGKIVQQKDGPQSEDLKKEKTTVELAFSNDSLIETSKIKLPQDHNIQEDQNHKIIHRSDSSDRLREDQHSSQSSRSSETDDEDREILHEMSVKPEEIIRNNVENRKSPCDLESENEYSKPEELQRSSEEKEFIITNINKPSIFEEQQSCRESSVSSESDKEDTDKKFEIICESELDNIKQEQIRESVFVKQGLIKDDPTDFKSSDSEFNDHIEEQKIKQVKADMSKEPKTPDSYLKKKIDNLSKRSCSSSSTSNSDSDSEKSHSEKEIKPKLFVKDQIQQNENETKILSFKASKDVKEVESQIENDKENPVQLNKSDTNSSDSDSDSESKIQKCPMESKRKLSSSSSSSSDSDREPPALPSSCPPSLVVSKVDKSIEIEYNPVSVSRDNSKNAYENVILPSFKVDKDLSKETTIDEEFSIKPELKEKGEISPKIEQPIHSEAQLVLHFEPTNIELKTEDPSIECNNLQVKTQDPIGIESQIIVSEETPDIQLNTGMISSTDKETTPNVFKAFVPLPSMSVSKIVSCADKSFPTDLGEKLMLPGKGIHPEPSISPEMSYSEDILVETPTVKKDVSFEFLPDIEKTNELISLEKQDEYDISNSLSEQKPSQKTYAQVDTDVLKKAALMSQKMAKQITSRIIDDCQEKDKETEEETSGRAIDGNDELDSEPNMRESQLSALDEKKARRLAMFRDLEYSTRPFRKKVEDDSNPVADVTVDFRNKMKMWNRKSSCNVEPDYNRLDQKETLPRKRLSLTSPFLTSSLPTSPSPTEQTHMKKLHESLPKEPQPGSVADYIRKLSVSSPTTEEDLPKETKADTKIEVLMRPRPEVVDKSDIKKRYSDITPSIIFSSRQIPRGRPSFQNRKLDVRPMSVELKDVVDSDQKAIPKERPKSLTPQKKSTERMTVKVQSIEKKIESENGKDSLEDINIRKRPPISRGQSPRRSLSLTSPTRPDINVRNPEERDRNIWTDLSPKPPSPNLKRRDSIEVKVRPVTKQLSKDEKDDIKKEKELERQGSFKSARPQTPTRTLPKVDVSVKPLSAQDDKDERNKPAKKRTSILSVVKKNVKPHYDVTRSKEKEHLQEPESLVRNETSANAEIIEPVNIKEVQSQPTTNEAIEPVNIKEVQSQPTTNEAVITPCVSPETKGKNIPENEVQKEELAQNGKCSSYKQEKDKEMKKCSSIFSKYVKTIEQGETIHYPDINKDKDRTLPSSSSPLLSPREIEDGSKEKMPSKSKHADLKLQDKIGNNIVSRYDKKKRKLSSSSSSPSSESGDDIKQPIETKNAGLFSDNSQKTTENKLTECVTLPLPEQKLILPSSSSDGQIINKDKPQKSSSLRPSSPDANRKVSSSSSAAEIEKTELKEELQDIVKELEQGMVEKDINILDQGEHSKSIERGSSDSDSSDKERKKPKVKRKKKKKKKEKIAESSSSESDHKESDSDNDKDKSLKQSSNSYSEGKPSQQQKNEKQSQDSRKTSQSSNQSNESVDSNNLAEANVKVFPTDYIVDAMNPTVKKPIKKMSSSSTSSECSDLSETVPNEVTIQQLSTPRSASPDSESNKISEYREICVSLEDKGEIAIKKTDILEYHPNVSITKLEVAKRSFKRSSSSSTCSESDKEEDQNIEQKLHLIPVRNKSSLPVPAVFETMTHKLENMKLEETLQIQKEISDYKSSSSSSRSSISESDSRLNKMKNEETLHLELNPEIENISLEDITPQIIQHPIKEEKVSDHVLLISAKSSSSSDSDSGSKKAPKMFSTKNTKEPSNGEVTPEITSIVVKDGTPDTNINSPISITKLVHDCKKENSETSSSSSSSSDSEAEFRIIPKNCESNESLEPINVEKIPDTDISEVDTAPKAIQAPIKENTEVDLMSDSKVSSRSSSGILDSELEELQKAYENVQILDTTQDDYLVQAINAPAAIDFDLNFTIGDDLGPDVISASKPYAEDSLLQSVIEDSLPFKAPILENMIKTASVEELSCEGDSSDEDKSKNKSSSSNSSNSDSDSSDDLYSNCKTEGNDVEYILPECNIITADFEFLDPKKGIHFASIEPLNDPMDIQVFVIPDRPVDTVFLPKYQEPVLVLPECDILKSDYHIEDLIVPSPPSILNSETTSNNNTFEDKKDNVTSESDDALLKNIMHERQMNIRNDTKRDDCPYTSDEENEDRKDNELEGESKSSDDYPDNDKKDKRSKLKKVKSKLKKLKDNVLNKKQEESSSFSDSESDYNEKPAMRKSRQKKAKSSKNSKNDENPKQTLINPVEKRDSSSNSSDSENKHNKIDVTKHEIKDNAVKDILKKKDNNSSSSDFENAEKEKPNAQRSKQTKKKIKISDDTQKFKKPKKELKVSDDNKKSKKEESSVSSTSDSNEHEIPLVELSKDCDKGISMNIKPSIVDFKLSSNKALNIKASSSLSSSDSSDDENTTNSKTEGELDKDKGEYELAKKPKKSKEVSKKSESSSSSSSSESIDSESENKDNEKLNSSKQDHKAINPESNAVEKVNNSSEPAKRDIVPADSDECIIPVIHGGVTAELQAPKKPDNQYKEGNIVDTEFLIGREKDPSKSEVARLIQQSLELDRRREEQRRLEQERLRELQDQLKPRDEVLEHEHQRHLSEIVSEHDNETEQEQEESSIEDEVEEQEMSEELLAGEATPMSMPSGVDTDNSVSSPEEGGKPVVEVFDLQESSGEDISPDMESQALFVKLKEAQCKNAVLEAELTKLKARLIVLENADSQQKQAEKKCEEMAARLRETERSLTNARKEINHYQSSDDDESDTEVESEDMMEGSQGQYIALEKKMKGEFTALEKKYHKAKKLIKEYQQREKDFIAERESFLQQQTEKDQQYNALVKSLKDRIFQLEGELRSVQTAAGLPVSTPGQEPSPRTETVIAATSVPTVHAIAPMAPIHDSGSPVMSPAGEKESMSSESDVSSAEPISPVHEGEIRLETSGKFESVPAEGLLDTSIHRAKAQAANAARRPPSKLRPKSADSVELMEGVSDSKQDESGLETWIKHDSDNTVKKSDLKKRKAQLQSTEISQATPPASETTSPVPETPPTISETPLTDEKLPPPPPPPSHPPPSLPDSETSETSRERKNSDSEDTSSTVSQTSYDPTKPNFRGMDSEIPTIDTNSTDTSGTNETGESGTEQGNIAKKSKGLLPKLPFKFGGGGGEKDKGGVMLLSSRSLNKEDAGSMEGGITLVSRKKLDTGLDYDGASTISDTSSGYMVGEVESSSYNFSGTPANEDHPSLPGHHAHNQFQSCPITEWNQENINYWLMAIEMEKYAPLFSDKSINGPQLVALDSNKLKTLGISNSKDRDTLKKKIKELKVVLEKERKQQEKERKQQEKEQRAREKEQKKMFKKK